MKKVTELVDLPDPAVQPLVHPLDLPEARRLFRTSWLVTALTGPAVGLCIGVSVWFASRSYVLPAIAGGIFIGLGALASRYWRDQAWAFIPRKRQDRRRPLPLTWELGSSVVLATMLAVVMVLVAIRLDERDVTPGVTQLTLGMAFGVSVLMAVDLANELRRHRGGNWRSAVRQLPVVVAVLGGTAAAWAILSDPARTVPGPLVLYGAAIMLMVGAATRVWKQVAARGTRDASRSPTD